jgi:hypothetical protein
MKDCGEVSRALVATARREPLDAAEQALLERHLEICADCRLALANQRMLSAGLAVLAESDGRPPAELKAALMAEVRREVRRHGRVRKWPWVAAAAAALFAGAYLVTPHFARPDNPPVVKLAPPSLAPAGEIQRVARPAVQVKLKRRHRATVPRPSQAEEAPGEVATDFFAIPYTEPLRPEERADVFRVEVPRASMAAFGLPVAGGRLDSAIAADVVVGEDGVTRAIRFIR